MVGRLAEAQRGESDLDGAGLVLVLGQLLRSRRGAAQWMRRPGQSRPSHRTPADHPPGQQMPRPPPRALTRTRSRSLCVTLSCTHSRNCARSGVPTPRLPARPPLVLAGCERCWSPSPSAAASSRLDVTLRSWYSSSLVRLKTARQRVKVAILFCMWLRSVTTE